MSASEHSKTPSDLLQSNKTWAERLLEEDPDYFKRLVKIQQPRFLWIGCSDSRVPANQIVDLAPGEVFVHRNIANVVGHTDSNCLTVLQYAVEVLNVEHVIVTGHYGCGGIEAAMQHRDCGQLENWLCHIKDVYHAHANEIDAITEHQDRLNKLCELNVKAQVEHVAQTAVVQRAWQSGKKLSIHGWIYSLKSGLLTDLGVSMNSADKLHPIYHIHTK